MSPARKLQVDIAAQSLVMVPGAPDALSARLVENAGFAAVYMTGFSATASRLGTPDIGLLSQTEMATLKDSGRSEHDRGTMVSYEEFCDLVDLNFHRQLDDRFGA